jgi:hypothetical protein
MNEPVALNPFTLFGDITPIGEFSNQNIDLIWKLNFEPIARQNNSSLIAALRHY